jgi:hypothetical protein
MMLFKFKDRQITLAHPRRGVLSLAVLPREMTLDLDNNVASGSSLVCKLTRYELFELIVVLHCQREDGKGLLR